jgi:hypothetical protein
MLQIQCATNPLRVEGTKEPCEKRHTLVRASLLINVLQVVLDGELADPAAGGDFLVGKAAEKKFRHEGFPRSE